MTSSLLLRFSTLLPLALAGLAAAYDNGLALTPQMGWNTWNKYGCDINEVRPLFLSSVSAALGAIS